MPYNAVDLIEKVIDTANYSLKIYENILGKNVPINALLLRNVLIKNYKKNIVSYKEIKADIKEQTLEDIDFIVYDKISFLVNEFISKHKDYKAFDLKELLSFSIYYEKEVLALLIDLQGRLTRSERDVNTKAYEILGDIIKRKEILIQSLGAYLSKENR